MKKLSLLRRARREEDGAVTTEWVVLTAIVAVLAVAVVKVVGQGTYAASLTLSNYLQSVTVQDDF